MHGNWPIVLIELLLVLGGALLFGWWQLRDLKQEQARRRAETAAQTADPSGAEAGQPAATSGLEAGEPHGTNR